jgi:hypothetical protein
MIGFIFWMFVVPSLVGSLLILAALAAFVPPLYFALSWFLIAFATGLLLCGPFWVIPSAPFARSRFGSYRCKCQQINPSQEKNNETHHQDKVFFQ